MSIFKKIAGNFVEFDEPVTSPKTDSKSNQNTSALQQTVQTTASTAVPQTDSVVDPAVVAEAQNTVLTWAKYSALVNLQKFTKLKDKFASKISDEASLIDVALESLETAAGIAPSVVRSEAVKAVEAIHAELSAHIKGTQKYLESLKVDEEKEHAELVSKIATLQRSLEEATTSMNTLTSRYNHKRSGTQEKTQILTQVAEQVTAPWSTLISKVKS